MANYQALNDDALEAAVGGAAEVNTTDWAGAHWQPTNREKGSTWKEFGYDWYRVKSGDTLSGIAQKYGFTIKDLMYWNPKTIKDPNMIYAGDALVLAKAPL